MLSHEKTARIGLGFAVLGVLGVALAPLTSPLRTAFGVVLLAGWLGAAWGLHRFGRAG